MAAENTRVAPSSYSYSAALANNGLSDLKYIVPGTVVGNQNNGQPDDKTGGAHSGNQLIEPTGDRNTTRDILLVLGLVAVAGIGIYGATKIISKEKK